MTIKSNEIELFKNLSQFDFIGGFYDFHNDFDCTKINYEDYCLTLHFRKIIGGCEILFKFFHVELVKINFGDLGNIQNITIDNIYRGRYERNGELIEFNNTGDSYFYLEFDEDIIMEFWSESVFIST